MRSAPVVLAAALTALLSACSAASSSTTPPHATAAPSHHTVANVSVWGDSLIVQTAPALEAEGRARDLNVEVHAYYGLAPCDVTTSVLEDVRSGIDAIVLAFSGDNLTPCMTRAGAHLQGAAYFAAYRRDVGQLVSAARARHVPVVIVGPPVFPPAQNHPDRVELRAVLRAVSAALGAAYVESAPALGSPRFTRTLPCLAGETADLGCSGGRITVRSGNGIHFDAPRPVPCPAAGTCTYSAGAHRYADVVLAALARIPALRVGPPRPGAGVPIVARAP